MKIAFLGDSITSGVPGVSYVDIFNRITEGVECTNYGRGGDTLISLNHRVKRKLNFGHFDKIVLFVGVNEHYGRISFPHKIIKSMIGQKRCHDREEAMINYREILERINDKCEEIIIIPPLVIGEDLTSEWNHSLDEIIDVIKTVMVDFEKTSFLDVRELFHNYLNSVETTDYLPVSINRTAMDVARLRTDEQVDNASKERGLHLTLDGVHLNSKGATIIAEAIKNYIFK